MNMNAVNFSGAIKTAFERRLLVRAQPRLVHAKFGVPARINQMGSYELRRYEALSAITTNLSEGVTPDELAQPTLTQLTVTPLWYGAWMGYTDKLQATAYDPILSEITSILGDQAGLTIDTFIRNAITDGATKDWSNAVTARGSLAKTTDDVDFADFIFQLAALQTANARGVIGGQDYAVIASPYSWASLMQDATFKALFQYEAGASPYRSGAIGRILGCSIFISSNARVYVDEGAGSPACDPASMLFIGADAYGLVGLGALTPNFASLDGAGAGYANRTGQSTQPVQMILKGLGETGLDPLNQRGTVGWKAAHEEVILQAVFMRDLEHTNVGS